MGKSRELNLENINKDNAAGNVMLEMKEADLRNFSAGAGEPKNSGGVVCSVTAECNAGTLVFFCC